MENKQQNHDDKCQATPEGERAASLDGSGARFEITVKGHLTSMWSDWLEGLDIKQLDGGEMVLSGVILDQAALMGILNKLNRLNLAIHSVRQVDKA